jgi:hypothetical protein
MLRRSIDIQKIGNEAGNASLFKSGVVCGLRMAWLGGSAFGHGRGRKRRPAPFEGKSL